MAGRDSKLAGGRAGKSSPPSVSRSTAGTPRAHDSSGAGKPARKHRATGKKAPGGKRAGAGRPEGTKNVLPLGAVSALRVGLKRVPDDAIPEERELASLAMGRITDVLMERVSPFSAFAVLQAGKHIREEICGKVADKLDVTLSLESLIVEAVPSEGSQR